MSLTIETNEMENRQLGMTIEVSEKRITGEMKKIVKKLAHNYHIPGFRKGKAPYKLLLKRFGEESIRVQAVEEIMDNVINEALDEKELQPVARLSLNNLEVTPVVKLDVIVPLSPEVTLGDYRELRREVNVPVVEDSAVEEAVNSIVQSHASTETITERTAALGDLVKIIGHGEVVMHEQAEGIDEDPNNPSRIELFNDHDGIEFELDSSKTFAGTDLVDNLVGMDAGESKSFTITYADDYEVSDFAGKQANIDIEVIEIYSRTLPELNDEFAVEANYESLDDMYAKLRSELEQEAEGAYKSEILDDWVEDLLKDASLVYPPALVDQELESSLKQLKEQVKNYQWEWSDYLESQETSEEQLKESWREDAAKTVENGLALREFIESERLKVREDELNARIDLRFAQYGSDMDDDMRDMMRNILLGPNGIQQLANEVMVDKAYERITLILGGEAPDLDELEAAEAAEEEARAVALAEAAAAAEAEAEEEAPEEAPAEEEAAGETEDAVPSDDEAAEA